MFLKSLNLTNFRNYSKLNFEFKTPITVLIGDNAQGKSNFLESIYFLATTKSLKADQDLELIKNGDTNLRVAGELEDKSNLEINMQNIEQNEDGVSLGVKKRIKVNGIGRRIVDYSGYLAAVLFSPEDINLVTGSPSLRRGFLDQVLSQADKEYKRVLGNYEDVVSRKNKVLKRIKEGLSRVDELTFWIEQQIYLGQILTQKRMDFFKFVNGVEKKFGDFSFKYLPSQISSERWDEYKQKEIDSSSSLIGPHRDDFMFLLNEKDLAKFGSRGEQRTAVLDLKISQVSFMEKVLQSRPLLLLDDIFSELDYKHREHVIDLISLQQTIIAAVELDDYLEVALSEATILKVESGQFKESELD